MEKKHKSDVMLFNEIDNFIEVYNNLVIELVQCFGTSFFSQIDHRACEVPKHCIRSITYNYTVRPMKGGTTASQYRCVL